MRWDLLETFLRVAEAGSLTGAAERLSSSQPTVTRELRALEQELGVPLFARHARGVTLTERGAELLPLAREVEATVQKLHRRASGLRQEPTGTVRISANEPIAVHALPPALAELRAEYPRLRLEVVVDNSASDLSRREADLAVRMFRPEQLDLVARRLGPLAIGLYAHARYLAERGEPQGLDDLAGHTLIGFDRDTFWLAAIREMGLRSEQFALRTDSMLVQTEAVLAGAGIGALHVPLASRHRELSRLLEPYSPPPLELWLVHHEDLRGDPAIRAVLAALERALRSYAGLSAEARPSC